MALFNFGKKKVIAELNAKYEAEYKEITGCTPDELKYPLIADDEEFAKVKLLRARILKEAINAGVAEDFAWLINA